MILAPDTLVPLSTLAGAVWLVYFGITRMASIRDQIHTELAQVHTTLAVLDYRVRHLELQHPPAISPNPACPPSCH
jgi:hypothetical protein